MVDTNKGNKRTIPFTISLIHHLINKISRNKFNQVGKRPILKKIIRH